MQLIIDIGNTRAKASIFDKDKLVFQTAWTNNDEEEILNIIQKFKPTCCAFSNVGHEHLLITEALHRFGIPVLRVSATTPSPVHNPFPTLGSDRLAAIVGAVTLLPHRELLVIDSGTCVTYDYIDADANLIGGNISPGLMLRLKAMHDHTALLPLIPIEGEVPDAGYDTPTAMRVGVVRGLQYKIEGFIRDYAKNHPQLEVFLTGGDSSLFSSDLQQRIHIEPQLVAIGLNRLLLS